jgi:tripartite-type tricarboxylate transporter receptor subunit TctC
MMNGRDWLHDKRKGGVYRYLVAIVVCVLAAQGLISSEAEAQSYPDRPVRVIVPFPAGGLTDAVARIVGQKLGEALGQNLVVENRTGASGTLGAALAAKANPDGYTLLITTGDFMTMQGVMPPLSFDPHTALTPITLLAVAPLLLVANPASGIGSVKDLVAAANARPGAVAYSSPGVGTINQLAAEAIAIGENIKLLHVPYRGGAPAVTAVAAGDVAIGAMTQSSGAGFIESGKVKVVALMTKQRPSFAPDWPTVAESGLDIDMALWVGLFAPAGTPATIVDKLDNEVTRILKTEDLRKQLNALGTDAFPLSQAAFAKRIRDDAARYAIVIDKIGLRPPQQ